MNATKLLNDVIDPVLKQLDMWSPSACKLLCMTAAHESRGFKYKEQMNGGPAISYYQIEPATPKDLYKNYLRFRPDLKNSLNDFWPPSAGSGREALFNDRFATAAARLIYFRVPRVLPPIWDDDGFATYWKTYWNTHLGAGTTERFLEDWGRYGFKYSADVNLAASDAPQGANKEL